MGAGCPFGHSGYSHELMPNSSGCTPPLLPAAFPALSLALDLTAKWLQGDLIQLADMAENSSLLWHGWFAPVVTATKCNVRKAIQTGNRDRNQLVHSPAAIPNCSLKSSHAYPAIPLFLPESDH